MLHLIEAGTEAITVCYLFSFVDSSHERRTAEIIREIAPETFISLSCDVLPEVREYERVSTAVVNAYVGPLIERYLKSLEIKLRDRDSKASFSLCSRTAA